MLLLAEKQQTATYKCKKKQPVDREHLLYFMPGKAHSYTESNCFDRLYNIICIYIQAVHII